MRIWVIVVVCALHALATDDRCTSVSLRACGLRSSSAGTIAAFAELHPRVCFLDLSQNSFSFEAGEVLLEALTRRSRGSSETSSGVQTSPSWKKLPKVIVDVGGTALAWDRGGFTVGPPSGNMWAGLNDSRARFAPSEYEKLRGRLDDCCKIQYDRPSSPRPDLQVPWRTASDAQNKAGPLLPQIASVQTAAAR